MILIKLLRQKRFFIDLLLRLTSILLSNHLKLNVKLNIDLI